MSPAERKKIGKRLPVALLMTRVAIEIGSATDYELLLWGLRTDWPFCAVAQLEIARRDGLS